MSQPTFPISHIFPGFSPLKTFVASFMGGCYVGMGGLLSLSIAGTIPGVAATNPGLVKFTFAALFPVNLLLVLQTGSQLFTGSHATLFFFVLYFFYVFVFFIFLPSCSCSRPDRSSSLVHMPRSISFYCPHVTARLFPFD
tara:strand:+ start:111 stop:530 length:420 start_codon:yes stop_codon:yes gene_type:complete